MTTRTDTETDGPRPDAPDTERTDTAAFGGDASAELELGREQQAAEQQTAEDAPDPEPEDTDANDDDATPPDFNPIPEPGGEPEPDAEDAGDAA